MMLKLLLKKQLLEIFQSYFYDAKKNRARSRLSTAMYVGMFALLMVGVLGGIFTFLAVKLCAPLVAAGLNWLYFALTGLIAVLLGAFGSVFNTYAGLYLPKDNDLLLSLPIPVRTLVTARLMGVYLMGLMYSAAVILPAVIVYWTTGGGTPAAVLGGLALTGLISVFVLTLSCVLGWVVAKISQKLKRKSFIAVLVSLAFIGLYYFVYFKAQSVIEELLANAETYGARIRSDAYPLYLFGRVGVGDGKATLIVFVAVAALFGMTWALLSRSFLRLATSSGKTVRGKYRAADSRPRGVDAALLGREWAHFAASPNYMLNCGLGAFLMPVGAAALLWRGGELFAALEALFAETPGSAALLLCVMLCGLASMNFMAAPSVSLEGRSLWLVQSLPLEPWRILRAKARLQLLLTLPMMLLCILCAAIACPLRSTELLGMALLAATYAPLTALSHLTLGVKLPTLTWTNEVMPVKQSAPVMLALFGGLGYTVLLFAGFMLLPGWTMGFFGYTACFTACNLVLCACNLLWLKGRGARQFAAL